MAAYDLENLKICDGKIEYKLYSQDGAFQHMTCPDTKDNRMFVSWVQKYDGYCGNG